jgi:parallel beta-helix repeat protein
MRRVTSVRATAALAGVLAAVLGLPATPALAGSGTSIRYVDDDGHASSTKGCAGTHHVAATISDAVNASGPGDTVLVCPGTYREQVVVNVEGLIIQGVSAWQAHVKPPLLISSAAAPSGWDPPVVLVTASNVIISGLNVIVPATGSCHYLRTGILVEGGTGVLVAGNRVSGGAGDPTACGLVTGIAWSGGAKGKIRDNLVRAFTYTGIYVNDSSDPGVINNAIELFAAPTCVTATVCAASTPRAKPAGGFAGLRGIFVANAKARIKNNTISVPDGAATGHNNTSGVESFMANSGKGLQIIGNRITGATIGIGMSQSVGVIQNNVVRKSRNQGISLYDSHDFEIVGNRVAGSANAGMYLDPSSSQNAIHDNDFTGNPGTDCVDMSGTTVPSQADPIDNTWTNDYGDEDSPDGICTPKP